MLDLLPFLYVERVAVLKMTVMCKDSSDCLSPEYKMAILKIVFELAEHIVFL